jgi:predicted enzyme related to lactoylglutathione lyase
VGAPYCTRRAGARYFSINADYLDRARQFDGDGFGWRFTAWGPPGLDMIETGATPGASAILGSLQGRRTLVSGARMTDFECTIAVSDIHAAERAIVAAGRVA